MSRKLSRSHAPAWECIVFREVASITLKPIFT